MVEMPPLRLAMLTVSHKSSFSSPITISFFLFYCLHEFRNCPQHDYMLQDISFKSLVNVVPLALFENVEFISLSTKRVFQKNAFSIWVVLHFKASQIFYFPFLQQLLQKYDKIITNTIAVLSSSSLKRKQKRTCSAGFHVQSGKLLFRMHNSLVVLLQKYQKTKSSQAPSHHL